jgi:predicted helicase
MYRPFSKQWVYFNRRFNNCVYQMPKLFPSPETRVPVICVTGGSAASFSCVLVNQLSEFLMMFNGQCFPLYFHGAKEEAVDDDLFSDSDSSIAIGKRDAISDSGLKHFQDTYTGETITKEDLFYYVLLHSEDYRTKYADNLSKELPRIPRVKTADDFWAFCRAGRALGELHVNYESVEPYPVTIKQGDLRTAVIKDPEAFYRVTKMRFAGKRGETDKTTVIYNDNITMERIPLEAYDYVVNGRPALEWVMERQVVKTDKDSGIVNDTNRYAIETIGNPAYPLELFQRVITVSLETMKIVRALPKLEVIV